MTDYKVMRNRYQRNLLTTNPLRNKAYWTYDDILKYTNAIRCEVNIYGPEKEMEYWKLALDTIDYGWTVDRCIRFKEQDVASDFQLLPSLYMSLRETYDKILFELEGGAK